MSLLNSQINRVVWCDVPVSNLERASAFYSAVLAIQIHQEKFGETSFAVMDHKDGNGGCLVPKPADVGTNGPLVYFNVNGRLAQAVSEAKKCGGTIVEPPHSIGPHGSRAIVIDSEGNRIALHSEEQTAATKG